MILSPKEIHLLSLKPSFFGEKLIDVYLGNKKIGFTNEKLINDYKDILKRHHFPENIYNLIDKKILIPVYSINRRFFPEETFKEHLEKYVQGLCNLDLQNPQNRKIIIFVNRISSEKNIIKITLHELMHYLFNFHFARIKNKVRKRIKEFYQYLFYFLINNIIENNIDKKETKKFKQFKQLANKYTEFAYRMERSVLLNRYSDIINLYKNVTDLLEKELQKINVKENIILLATSLIVSKIRFIFNDFVTETQFKDLLLLDKALFFAYKKILSKFPETYPGQELIYCSEIISISYSEKERYGIKLLRTVKEL